MKVLKYISICVSLALFFVLAGVFAPVSYGKNVINIGYTGPLSGGAALYGQQNLWGIEMAVDEINKAGGVEVAGVKYKLKLTSMDNEYKGDKTVANVKRMLSTLKPRPVWIYCPTSVGVLPMMEFNEKEGFIILAWTTHPDVVNRGNKLVIRPPAEMADYSSNWARAILAKGLKTCVTVPNTGEWSEAWMSCFTEAYEKQGGKVLDNLLVDMGGETDFYPYLTKLAKFKPQVTVAAGPAQPIAILIEQSRELGYNGPWFFAEQAEVGEILDLIPEKRLKKIGLFCGTAPYDRAELPPPMGPRMKKWIKRWRERVGPKKPFATHITGGYEFTYHLIRSMQKAGTTTDPYKIRKAMAEVFPWPEVLQGWTSLKENGDILYYEYALCVNNGELGVPFKILEGK